MVVEDEPVRPSQMARHGPPGNPPLTPADVALRRSTTPDRLGRTLAGDIDTILLTALRKEPGRRYATTADLAEDLRRFLDGLPVRARGDTFSYRAAKFVGRHRLAVTAGAAGLIVAVAMAAFYTVRLSRERDRAVVAAAKAEQVAGFLTDLFENANPEQTGGDRLTASELLTHGARRLDELEGQPDVQAALMHTIALAYIKLGMRDSAGSLLERALGLQEATLGPMHPDVARTLRTMGELAYEHGRYAEAAGYVERAERIQRDALAPDDPAYALTLNDLGWMRFEQGNLPVAESLHRAALAIRTRVSGARSKETAESQSNLASTLHQAGRIAEAESLYRVALATRRAVLGPANPLVGFNLNNLAAVLEEKRDLAPAESLYRESLEIAQRAFGADNPRVSTSHVNLGRVLGRLQRWDEAEAHMLRAVALDDGNDEYVAYDYRTLGDLMMTKRDPEAAERYYRMALSLYHRTGNQGVAPGGVLRGLAMLRLDAGRPADAEPLLVQALESWAALLPADHVDLNHLRALHGEALAGLGRHAEAESLLVASRQVLAGKLGASDERLRRSARVLAGLYTATGRDSLAATLLGAEP
jgi:serine/threonine-protein kinase